MRFVVQRVLEANVKVDGKEISKIDRGFMVLIGINENDTKEIADYMVKKLIGLRIFDDENDKMNLSLNDVDGSLLLVSQFTLYGDCSHGNRPSFIEAARPETANPLYEYIVAECKKKIKNVGTGIFGADMKVSLINDGPVTIIMEKN